MSESTTDRAERFTPGPWEERDTRPGRDVFSVAGKYIATVGHAGAPRQHENAHLIAAAPELYAALEHLVWLYADDVSPEETCWDAARDALAAARGER